MRDDVILNKVSIIERCLTRIVEEYEDTPENLHNYTKQDSIILNIQRICEACIDISMHVVSEEKLGVPQTSRDAFDLLCKQKIISKETADQMKGMVGFRNIAVHDYQEINLTILQQIIDHHLADIRLFSKQIMAY